MIKQAPSRLQVVYMTGFVVSCFALLLGLWLSFGGSAPLEPVGYRFHVLLPDAGSLQPQSDVRISGVSVGKVVGLKLLPRENVTDATVEIDAEYAPRPRDTRVLVRVKTILGESYLALSPGSSTAPAIPEGGTLSAAHVQHAVSFGELMDSFNSAARRSFGIWMTQQGAALATTGQSLNQTIGDLDPFARRTNALVELIDEEQTATRRLIANAGVALGAITAQPGRLRALVRSTDSAFAATAQEHGALAATIRTLGPFLVQSHLTLDRLAAFSRNARPLTNRLVPVAHSLTALLQHAPGFAAPLRGLLDAAPIAERASVRGIPAAIRVLRRSPPLLASLRRNLGQLIPVIDYAGHYRSDLASSIANLAAATEATLPGAAGTPLHLLRAVAALNPESLAAYDGRLSTDRSNPYFAPGAFGRLASGLQSWPTGCGTAPLPSLASSIAPEIRDLIERFFFTTSPNNVTCSRQAPLGPTVGHGKETFPLVTALP